MDNDFDDKPISAEDVLAFLQDNPKFLQKHPEAIDLLNVPKNGKAAGQKEIVDFRSYMIDRLKADKEAISSTTQELIDTARSNMNNQHRIHTAVLRLLEARTFDEFIGVITADLSSLLDTDISVLVVESDGHDIPHVQASGIRVVPPGTIDSWMDGKGTLIESDIHGIEAIYGGGATLVRSQALLRVDISLQTPPAILAFGSRDPHLFEEGQATDQVAFLARVVERMFRMWLHLPNDPK